MHLNVRDVARLLSTPEKQIYRWVDEGELPCARADDQPRFNRTELLEWATARGLPVTAELFADPEEGPGVLPSLHQALETGGVQCVGGTDRESVLGAVLSVMRLPEQVDREALREVLLAREALGATVVGEGIARPHVRKPIVVHGAPVSLALFFLTAPVDLKAPDGRPVHALFTLVCPTIRAHLQTLAKLSTALHDPAFKAAVLRHAPVGQILQEVRRVEERFSGRAAEAR